MKVYLTPDMSDPTYWEYDIGYNRQECEKLWEMLGLAKNQTINGKRYRRKYTVYTDSLLSDIPRTTDARKWRIEYWAGRSVRCVYLGTNKVVVRRILGLEEIPERNLLPAVDTFRNFLWDNGTDLTGSIGGMAERLYRRTLDQPLRFWIDAKAHELLESNKHGGRIGAKQGRFRDCEYDDIRCAFPSTMYANEWPTVTQYTSNIKPTKNTIAVLADVQITKDHDGWFPLPLKASDPIISTFGPCSEWIQGLWSPIELSHAVELGNKVRIIGTIESAATMRFNDKWWQQILTSRSLGIATPLAKCVINSLWGRFGMGNAASQHYEYTDVRGSASQLSVEFTRPSQLYPTNALAFALQAKVRERTWEEAILPCRTLYIATDGAIIENGRTPKPWGQSLGQWATKIPINQIHIKGPHCYAYKADDGPEGYYEYVVAGAHSREEKVAAFQQHANDDDVWAIANGVLISNNMDMKEINDRIARVTNDGNGRDLSSAMRLRGALQWAIGGRKIASRRTNRSVGPKHWDGSFYWGMDNGNIPMGAPVTETPRFEFTNDHQ